MTSVAPESAHSTTTRVPSIAVLGADALLAALPATPVQLAHACLLAGYQSVVPESWGDELIAAASLRALEKFGPLPAIQCSCPFVAHRLLAAGTDLRPFLVSLVAPPVATARYLRAAFAPAKLRITFIGRCPAAADESIDARLTPEELLASFADRGIVVEEQPRVFDSVIPPDRRRHRSQPGGLPTPEMLWTAGGALNGGRRSLVELHGDELAVELAQHLLAGKPVLIDAAGKLGCLCSGAVPGVDVRKMRAAITALEPPRAPSPVIDERVRVDLELPLPASPRSALDVVSPTAAVTMRAPASELVASVNELPASEGNVDGEPDERSLSFPPTTIADQSHTHSPAAPRGFSPSRGITRPMSGGLPTARDASGRQLPRTYVARRRSPPRGSRLQHNDAAPPTVHEPESTSTSIISESPRPEPPPSPSIAPHTPVRENQRVAEPESRLASRSERAAPAVPHLAVGLGGSGAMAGPALEATEPVPGVARAPAPAVRDEETSDDNPYRDRAVDLPLTPRSDAMKRDPSPASTSPAGERPLAQLLVIVLLISTIVLVSAAVGVVVGRWMAQR